MRALLVSLWLLAPLAFAAEPATPAPIAFDGEDYAFVSREVDAARIAENYLRSDETLARFSRRLTVADQPQVAGAKAVALGVMNIAKLRTPGIEPETFVAEGAEDHDISVAWFDLTDDNSAVEYHAVRFVDLAGGGVREYHFTVRRYTNGLPPDEALGALRGASEPNTLRWIELLSALDRAPAKVEIPAPPAAPTKKNKKK